MNSKLLLAFAVLAVVTVTIQAASLKKRETAVERPEEPLLQDCGEDGPGVNRENCGFIDPPNYDNWQVYLEDIKEWETKNPAAAEAFNAKNPNKKKQEQEKLEELKKYAAIHE